MWVCTRKFLLFTNILVLLLLFEWSLFTVSILVKDARFRRLENFERIKNAELAKFVMLRHGEDEDCLYEEKPRTLIHRESQLLIPDDMISDQEMLTQRKTNRVNQVIHHRMLLLDVRDSEAYSKCHIEGALLYEAPRLSRSVNALTPELLAFVCIWIVLYDWNINLLSVDMTYDEIS